MKKIIVCGAGQVGFNIAKHLANEQNDVTVIDRSPELVAQIRNSLDVQALVGYASHPDILENAGAKDADMIIAVTLFDEVNMVACQVAHSLFNVPTKIARVRAQNYLAPMWKDLFSTDNMPIDEIISPEIEVARAAIRRLEVPGAFDMIAFCEKRIQVVGVRIEDNCPVVDTPLKQLTELFPDLNIIVCGIIRNDKLIVPSAGDQLLIGDNIYFAAESCNVRRALAVFGHEEEEARKIIIIGGGNVGAFIADRMLEINKNIQIKIIEKDQARATLIAEKIPSVIILQGNAMDLDLLKEANAQTAETVIAVTNNDNVNILSSLLAKQLGTKRAITLINNQDFSSLTNSVGIDAFIDPRQTTVSSILQHMRQNKIKSLQSLAGGAAEVVEAVATEDSPLVGKPLREVKLQSGIIIAAIVRGEETIPPRGGTIIKANDIIIVFLRADLIKKVEDLFAAPAEYF